MHRLHTTFSKVIIFKIFVSMLTFFSSSLFVSKFLWIRMDDVEHGGKEYNRNTFQNYVKTQATYSTETII